MNTAKRCCWAATNPLICLSAMSSSAINWKSQSCVEGAADWNVLQKYADSKQKGDYGKKLLRFLTWLGLFNILVLHCIRQLESAKEEGFNVQNRRKCIKSIIIVLPKLPADNKKLITENIGIGKKIVKIFFFKVLLNLVVMLNNKCLKFLGIIKDI